MMRNKITRLLKNRGDELDQYFRDVADAFLFGFVVGAALAGLITWACVS